MVGVGITGGGGGGKIDFTETIYMKGKNNLEKKLMAIAIL